MCKIILVGGYDWKWVWKNDFDKINMDEQSLFVAVSLSVLDFHQIIPKYYNKLFVFFFR